MPGHVEKLKNLKKKTIEKEKEKHLSSPFQHVVPGCNEQTVILAKKKQKKKKKRSYRALFSMSARAATSRQLYSPLPLSRSASTALFTSLNI